LIDLEMPGAALLEQGKKGGLSAAVPTNPSKGFMVGVFHLALYRIIFYRSPPLIRKRN
jgi:hypothetical protein